MCKIIERGCDQVSLASYPHNCYAVITGDETLFFQLIKNARTYARRIRRANTSVTIEPRDQSQVGFSDLLVAERVAGFDICPLTRKQNSQAWINAVKVARRKSTMWRPLAIHKSGKIIVQSLIRGNAWLRD